MRALQSAADSFQARFLRKPPRVTLAPKVHRKIQAILRLVKKEISFLGTVEQLSPYEFLITEIFLFKQCSNQCESTLLASGQLDLMQQLMAEGATGKKKIEKLRFWGHSHGELPVFVSKTDDRGFQMLSGDGRPFQIMAIFNRKGEIYCEVFLAQEGIVIENVPLQVQEAELEPEILAAVQAEVDTFLLPVLEKKTGASADIFSTEFLDAST